MSKRKIAGRLGMLAAVLMLAAGIATCTAPPGRPGRAGEGRVDRDASKKGAAEKKPARKATGARRGLLGFFGRRTEITDDFSRYGGRRKLSDRWEVTGFAWSAKGGVLMAEDPTKTFCMARKLPHGRRVRVEATVKVVGTTSRNWCVAGVVVRRDEQNHWHLAMVKPPEDSENQDRFFELVEEYDGKWLANSQDETKLPTWGESVGGSWEMGKTYRLELELSPEGIVGLAKSEGGTLIWRRGFQFAAGVPAVKSGRPGLDCGGFKAVFDDVYAKVDEPVPAPKSELAAPPPPYDAPPMTDIRGEATGFFRVEERDGVWWLFDPKGFAFYDIGTDHARYQGHWCQKLGYAPYGRNVKAKYGSEDAWAASTIKRLKEWGFNTLAAGHSKSLRHRGLVHTEFISFGSRFSAYSDIAPKVHWTGFPNVFHPRWEAYCDVYAERFCARQKDDPWLLGYFLDNELEWYGKDHTEYGLVHEVFKKPAEHSAKKALVEFLRKRYSGIAELNKAWDTDYEGFGALAESTKVPPFDYGAGEDDRRDFLRLIAERYFAVTTRAIRRHDPNHLIIGCRFAGRAPEVVWPVAGKYLDVVSCNYYGRVDLESGTATETKERLITYYYLCGRPMMLTEWSHPALDSGLPCKHGAGQRFDTQSQRARAYEIYQRMLTSLPFMVGSHFFMWVDEPAEGIADTFPEDTNYGLVNEKDEPYEELTRTAARVNRLAPAFHGKETAEISVEIEADGKKAIVRNSGRLPAAFEVEIWEDGERRTARMNLAGGHAEKLELLQMAHGGPHFVVVRADPQRRLAEADLSNNMAFRQTCTGRPSGDSAVVAIANPTDRTIENAVVEIRLADLWPGRKVKGAVPVPRNKGEKVAYQMEPGPTLVVLAEKLGPFAQEAYVVKRDDRFGPSPPHPKPVPFEIDNGVLRLRKFEKDADLVDEVRLGGVVLGKLQALIHQNVGQDLWVRASRILSVAESKGRVRTTLRFRVEFVPEGSERPVTKVDKQGKMAAVERRPMTYEADYELKVSKGQPFFTVKCTSVKNTDRRPWRLESYFHYAPSMIGGDASDDHTPVPGIPNYYGCRTVWVDEKTAAAYGVVAPDGIKASFWVDEAGNQHPDVRREIGRVLQPGDVWRSPEEPDVYVFGVKGPAKAKPWNDIVRRLQTQSKLKVALYR